MKIIVFCEDQPNQQALVNKINQNIDISDLVLLNQGIKTKQKIKQKRERIIKAFQVLLTFAKYRRVWFGLLAYYQKKYPSFPIKPALIVRDINHRSVINFIECEKPDLVVVSGTNLLKDELIAMISKHNGKIINLHTGISPYVRGGPNCTNWCLYLKEFGMIGNTIMWLDEGIDSGNIISTEQTLITGREDLLELHIKVMDHAHDLYLRAISKFIAGKKLANLPQSACNPSRLFLGKDWRLRRMIFGLINFYLLFKPGSKYFTNPPSTTLVKL